MDRVQERKTSVSPEQVIAQRDVTIDVMRGVSILIVLIGHFHNTYSLSRNIVGFYRELIVRVLLENEHYGVIIFFTISGFLITSNIYKRYGTLGNINVREFYAYRFARIFPCLVLFVVVVGLGCLLGIPRFTFGGDKVPDYLAVMSALLPFHNVLIIYYGWFSYCLNILWSIAIEEAFYLFAPAVVSVVRREAAIGGICVALAVIGPIYRWLADERVDEYYAFLSCFDAIALGCLTAMACRRQRFRAYALGLRLAGAGLLLLASLAKPDIGLPLGNSIVTLGASSILLTTGSVAGGRPGWMVRAACWFGSRSYELYLFHIIVLAVMRAVAGPGPIVDALRPGWMLIYIGGSAATASIVANCYSNPLNRALRKGYRRMTLHGPLLGR